MNKIIYKGIYIVVFSFLSIITNAQFANYEPCKSGDPEYKFSVNDDIEMGVWYKDPRNANSNDVGKLTKPFIVLEGYDPQDETNYKDIYLQINQGIHLLDVLRTDGYDIVVVNLKHNTQSIIKNGDSFKELISDINILVQANGSLHRLKVCGISMGGLISRYALAAMEKDNIDHRVELLICFDSPHKGANVPLALQAFAAFIKDPAGNLGGLIPDIADPMSYLNQFMLEGMIGITSLAANQMAYSYITENLERPPFLNRLGEVNNYPRKSRNVGISCGSDNIKQDHIDEGDQFFNWEGGLCVFQKCVDTKIPDIGEICVEWCPVKIITKCYAMPGRDLDGLIFRGALGTEPMPTINKLDFIYPSNHNNYSWDRPDLKWKNLDHVPGSFFKYDMLSTFADTVNNGLRLDWDFDQNIGIPLTANLVFGIPVSFNVHSTIKDHFGYVDLKTDKLCFVPTISALDIQTEDYFYDVRGIPKYPYPHDQDLTPFDAIHCLNPNKERGLLYFRSEDPNHGSHAYMPNDETADFMMEEVSPDDIYIQNKIFSSGYTNNFECRGNIVIGNNVDPVPNRTDAGGVMFNGEVILSPGNGSGKVIDFLNGTDTAPGAIVTTEFNTLNNNSRLSCPGWSQIQTYKTNPSEWSTWRVAATGNTIINNSTSSDETENEYGVYPNPSVDPQTKLVYKLKEDANITIVIQDAMGKEIGRILDNNKQVAGQYTYDFNNSNLKSGLYFINFIVDGQKKIIKFVLQR